LQRGIPFSQEIGTFPPHGMKPVKSTGSSAGVAIPRPWPHAPPGRGRSGSAPPPPLRVPGPRRPRHRGGLRPGPRGRGRLRERPRAGGAQRPSLSDFEGSRKGVWLPCPLRELCTQCQGREDRVKFSRGRCGGSLRPYFVSNKYSAFFSFLIWLAKHLLFPCGCR